MAGSTRIKGKALMLTIDAEDHWADVTAVTIENEEADDDVVTFADAAAGDTLQEFLNITAIQSTQASSFWSMVWDNSGEDVPFVYAPHGNTEPTPDQPHFTGTCTIGPRPVIGGEAGRTVTYTFETRFNVVGRVVKDTGTP